MKQLALNKWFTLPRLGKETFSELMRAKVKYDSKFGFQLTSSTDLPRVISILSDALGEDVALASACFICEKEMEEDSSSICDDCAEKESAYDLYCMRFAKLMERI